MSTPYVKGNIVNGQPQSAPEDTDNVVCALGYCAGGTGGAVGVIADYAGAGATDVKNELGRGKLAHLLGGLMNVEGHGPAFGVPLASSAGTNSAVTATGTSPPAVTVTGTPDDDGQVRVEILKAGARGTATFRFCTDWDAKTKTGNWSTELVTAATYLIAGLNVTLNFATGTNYSADNRYEFTCTAPTHSNTNITDGFDVVIASGRDVGCVVVLASSAGATDTDRCNAMASMFAAISTKLDALQTGHRPVGCVIEAPSPVATDTAGMAAWRTALNAAEAALTDKRIQIATGHLRKASPFDGNLNRRNLIFSAAEKWSKVPISEDFGRKASGALRGVTSIEHDQFAVGGISARYTTARTIPRESGFYLTEGRQFDSPGGSYELTQHLRIVNRGYKVAYSGLLWYLNESFFTAAGGKITEEEAKSIDADITTRLYNDLVATGHVSDVFARVSRNDTILSTKKLRAQIGIRFKGYAKFIEFDIGPTL